VRHGIVYDQQSDDLYEFHSDSQGSPKQKPNTPQDLLSSRDRWIKKLDESIGYCLAMLLFILFFEHTNTTAAVLYLLPLILWITRMALAQDFRLIKTPILFPLLVLVLMAFISTVFSMDRWYSLDEFRGEILKQLMLFLIVVNNMRNPKQIRNLLIGLFSGAVCMSIVGIVGYYMGWTVYEGRTISWYSNMDYTTLPCYLAINVALALSILYCRKNRTQTLLSLLGLTTVCVWCILLTFTRAVWVALGVGGSFISIVYRKYQNLFLLALIIIVIVVFPNPFQKRLLSIADLRNYLVPGAILSERVIAWKSALDMIKDRPLTGIGYGAELFKKIYPLYIYPGAKEPMTYAHNLFLDITVQMGIPGLIVFVWLLISYFRGAITAYRQVSSPFLRAIILGSITSIIILLVSGLAHLMLFNELGLLIFILMGVTYSRTVQENRGTLEWNHSLQRLASRWGILGEEKKL